MKKLVTCLIIFVSLQVQSIGQTRSSDKSNEDYTQYHDHVIEAELLIVDQKYAEALLMYEEILNAYDFVFLNEYQIATQLAVAINDHEKAIKYLQEGIDAGWTLKSIKKNEYLKNLQTGPEWKSIKQTYKAKYSEYEAGLNPVLRKKVKKMYTQDQWKAIGALFTFSSKRQDRYAEKKFAPHSIKQMDKLISILNESGYPGERLIGNNYWMSTVLSHHNSISQAYVEQDTLYQFVKPKLVDALKAGQMSPWEFALVDDWYRAVKSDRNEAGYGFLNQPTKEKLTTVNQLRDQIGLRSVETRNGLVDIENLTGMNFYMPGKPWVDGKIKIRE
jgi:hypothetical protein